jgi:hypothetical protein
LAPRSLPIVFSFLPLLRPSNRPASALPFVQIAQLVTQSSVHPTGDPPLYLYHSHPASQESPAKSVAPGRPQHIWPRGEAVCISLPTSIQCLLRYDRRLWMRCSGGQESEQKHVGITASTAFAPEDRFTQQCGYTSRAQHSSATARSRKRTGAARCGLFKDAATNPPKPFSPRARPWEG